jgi:hypothetical protein
MNYRNKHNYDTSVSFPTAQFRFAFPWKVAPRPWIWRRRVGLILNGLNVLEEMDISKLEDDIQHSLNVGHQQLSQIHHRTTRNILWLQYIVLQGHVLWTKFGSMCSLNVSEGRIVTLLYCFTPHKKATQTADILRFTITVYIKARQSSQHFVQCA